MKKSFLITAIVLVLSGSAFAQTVLPLLPSAHGLTGNQPAYSAQQQQEFPAMATGWNWWSSYIDLSDDGLERLETMLGSNASTIKSQTQFTSYGAGVWTGALNSISNDQMYMIKMTSLPAEYMTISNNAVTINDIDITAHSGWTWVGFPSNTEISVNDALANYEANNGDIIKGMNAFATYNNGSWTGALSTMQPGKGYMMKNTGSNQTFKYAAATRGILDNETPKTQWIASIHDFPTNMSMMAVINLMGEELRSSDYEVAAFSGNVCRGTVVPQYVEMIDRYVAFLSISGENNDDLQFRLLDHETGDVYVANNRYNYCTDVVEGTLDKPYVLNFNTMSSTDELVASHLDLFPNPVVKGQMVKVSVPSNRKNLKVQVINALGMVVMTTNMSGEEMEFAANFAPGFYTIKVVAGDKQLFVEKLIVK